jgi:DNA-binding winged helix-turn-helix (wHTH) protein
VRYSFGEYVVDTRAYTLSRADVPVAVRPKVFDVLRYLIENRARVVSKQELLDALWREAFVDDFAVPWTVSHLRKVLDQERGVQAPIQTVRGRGYRFVAEVVELAQESSAALVVEQGRGTRQVEAPFVGRDALMEQLSERASRAQLGSGSCVLLVGDAGMGKTRCIDELSALARARGFACLSGRSFEAICNPVFWPWIQILRQAADEFPERAEAARALEARPLARAR